MKYKIIIQKAAKKFILKQSRDTQERLLKAINKLPEGDTKKLTSANGYRLRVGDFRVIFTKDDVVKIISIENIGNRGQVYKDM